MQRALEAEHEQKEQARVDRDKLMETKSVAAAATTTTTTTTTSLNQATQRPPPWPCWIVLSLHVACVPLCCVSSSGARHPAWCSKSAASSQKNSARRREAESAYEEGHKATHAREAAHHESSTTRGAHSNCSREIASRIATKKV